MRLRIDELAAGGDAVGRDEDGRVTFVPGAVPGDLVEVEITKATKGYARARIEAVVEPSEHRVDPRCAVGEAGRCGGCPWQVATLEAQHEAKRRIAANALRHAMARGLELLPLESPCEPWGWRRRARLHYRVVGRDLHLGYCAPRSNRIESIEHCPQLDPALEACLPILRSTLGPGLRRKGQIALLLAEDGRVHVALEGTCRWPAVDKLAKHPRIAGVVYQGKSKGQRRVPIEGGLRGSARFFAQASRAGNVALRECVQQMLGELQGRSLLELYAGSGNFTSMLGAAERVVAVESAGRPPGLDGVDWRVGLAEKVSADLAAQGERFDVLLLDPPRGGAREALAACVPMGMDRIIYVSCDAATLGRDLDDLAERGYRALRAQPIDLMPQTAHLELVVLLEKA